MTKILTVTMNPALDLSTACDRLVDQHKLRCEAPHVHPGGGGINVARVVHRLGGEVTALYPSGGPTGERLRLLLDAEGVASDCVRIDGNTRESFSVIETSTGREYRFVLPGPRLTETEWRTCLERATLQQPAPAWLVASGSLPPGVPEGFYARLAQAAKAQGTRVVVDSSGPALEAALDAGVELAKPSLRELRELTGRELATAPEWEAAAQALVRTGRARLLALSLGEQGAVLVSADQVLRAAAIPVQVHSTIGAGDSFLAALVMTLSSGDDLHAAFATAMAAGAAALLAPGTALCDPREVARLRPQVRITS